MQTIAILNSKGGSGKTTISTNLASYYAETGHNTVLIDYDSQGSSTHWANTRSQEQATIHCIPAYQHSSRQTRTFQMRLPTNTQRVIIDTPAAVTHHQLKDIANRSDIILIPVLPSSIDIHAVSDFIKQLYRIIRIRRGETKLAVVASRVNADTIIYDALEQYLQNTDIPFIAKIRDTQNYIHTTNEGKGLFEIHPHYKVAREKSDWHPLINWIEQKEVFSELKAVPSTDDAGSQELEQPLEHAI